MDKEVQYTSDRVVLYEILVDPIEFELNFRSEPERERPLRLTTNARPNSDEHHEVRSNMKKIAAAWNAVEGIPTEALESGVVQELAEALKRCRDVVDGVYESGDLPHNAVLIDALEAADAVLAKLRGDADA